MTRYLFVVPPLVGHINPLVGVAAELTARGHRVAWAGHPDYINELVGPAADLYPCDTPSGLHRPPELRGIAALQFLWQEFFVPLADSMAPGVDRAIAAFHPDVVVTDQQTVAGALAAERHHLPYVTSATTPAEFSGSLDSVPKVAEWIAGLLTELRARHGATEPHDLRFSPHGVLAFSTPELAGQAERPGIHWVGPAIAERPAPDFPWEWLDPDRALVLVSLGTVNTNVGARFLTECAAAAHARRNRLQTVIVDPGGVLTDDEAGPGSDDSVLVAPRVPQLPLLERASAVVCHAGHNTVAESLWHGVPLVVAPVRDDQPVIAAQVTECGAGVRVRFGRAGREHIGAALDAVLTQPEHRAAALRVQSAFRAAGGAAAAADHLEALAPTPTRLAEAELPT
ncbi:MULTISPECIES: glycosyltransferase [unclassified Streptomyces]|uniref:glycosyltransferase n=1 Tax=unclassified Streptomyces TaxID=2593676 RepID=UPI00278C7C40|nr:MULTISPECIES: glycosyltransferase [unclassified Streptomyces]